MFLHQSVLQFVEKNLTTEEIKDKRVLEVGARNINGSPRPHIMGLLPLTYVGVDIVENPMVDILMDATNLIDFFGLARFDIVVSTEMLEHALDWKSVIHNMKSVLVPGGLLLITARGPGTNKHDAPSDYWRFTVDDMNNIFSDFEIMISTKDAHPGVLFKGRKPIDFKERPLDNINVMIAPQC